MARNTLNVSKKIKESITDSVAEAARQGAIEGLKKAADDTYDFDVDKVKVNNLEESVKKESEKQVSDVKIKGDIEIDPGKVDVSKIKKEIEKVYKKLGEDSEEKGTAESAHKLEKRFLDLINTYKKYTPKVEKEYLEYEKVLRNINAKPGESKGEYFDYKPVDLTNKYLKGQTKAHKEVKKAAKESSESVIRAQDDIQAEIDKTNKSIETEKRALENINRLISGEGTKYSGKREATNALRYWNQQINDANGKATNSSVVSYMNAYMEAERIGVAQSSLDRYFNAEAHGRYNKALKALQNSAKITGQSIEQLESEVKDLNKEMESAPILSKGDKGLINYLDDLTKVETESKEVKEAIKEAMELSAKQDAGSSVDALAMAYDRVEREAREAANSIKELWIRAEGGSASGNFIKQALNDYTTQTTVTHTNKEGNEISASHWDIQYDKMKSDILKKDKEILELEYKINNAQGDTSGSQEKLRILKEERLAMFDVLDAAINDSAFEVTDAQRDTLNLIRQTEQAKILAEQQDRKNLEVTKAQIIAEKENAAMAEKTAKAKQVANEKNKTFGLDKQIKLNDLSEYIQKLDKLGLLSGQAFNEAGRLQQALLSATPDTGLKSFDKEFKIFQQNMKESVQLAEENVKAQEDAAKAQQKADEAAIEAEQKRADEAVKAANKEAEARKKLREQKQKQAEKEFVDRGTAQNKEALNAYNELIKEQNKYYELRKKHSIDADSLTQTESETFNRLTQEIAEAIAGQGKFEAANNGSVESLNKLQTAQTELNQYFSQTSQKVFDVSQNLDKMRGRLEELAGSNKYTSKLNSDLIELAERIKTINANPIDLNSEKTVRDIAEIEAAEVKLLERTKAADEKLASSDSISKLNLKIEEFIQKNSKMGNVFRKQFENLKIKWDSEESVQGVKDLATQFHRLEAEVYAADKAGKSFFDTLGGRIKQMSTNFIAMYFSLYDIVRYVREAVGTIQELDTSLVDLRKTTTMTNAELNDFYMNSSNIAKQMGATTQEIIQQAANWSRFNKIDLLYGNV